MTHVLAILGFAALCVLWVGLQRLSGDGGEHGDESATAGTCGFCGRKALEQSCDKAVCPNRGSALHSDTH
ncbi:MAG: hypothetical protein M5R36_24475 [Deltaproteobacteria bacterium]|nr:hypothetical protein [Deltaproteobacteria bacterium]